MSARDVIANNLTFYGDMVPADLYRQTDAILSALRSAGFAVVPVEPTEGMVDAYYMLTGHDQLTDAISAESAWSTFLKAAQEDSRE